MGRIVFSKSPEETIELGKSIAQKLMPGDILAFSGNLGAGKTCFIRGVCYGLGVSETTYITSPSFVILNRYSGRFPVYHFDFYRLSSKTEIIDLGYEECFFGEGISLIEWAERAEGLLPEDYIRIDMQSISPTVRRIEFSFFGEEYKRRLSDGVSAENR